MLKFFLALRYLKKRKIVFLSIAAVALSTALLVTVASLFTAFIGAIELSASEYLGDIVLEPPTKFSHYDILLEKLNSTKEIDSATPILSTSGLIHLGAGNVKAINIWGIEPASRGRVTNLKNNLLKQQSSLSLPKFENDDANAIPIFIGIAVLSEPNVKTDEYDFASAKNHIGKKAVFTTGSIESDDNSPANFSRSRSVPVVISDVIFTSVYDIDKKYVFMPIGDLAGIMYPQGKQQKIAESVHIKCAVGFDLWQTMMAVGRIWSDFATEHLNWSKSYIAMTEISTAIEKQAQYAAELRKQMGVLLVIFGIISAGVIVLVFCIFYMIVSVKQKDLAIIKSLGSSSGDVASVFLIFGLFIGIIGAALGVAVGFVITHYVNGIEQFIGQLLGLRLWSSSVYLFTKIPNQFNWFWAICFFISAVAASVLGALLPSISAARAMPVKILRYE